MATQNFPFVATEDFPHRVRLAPGGGSSRVLVSTRVQRALTILSVPNQSD